MSRIPVPESIEQSLPAAQPQLEAVKRQFGVAPNLFRLLGNSPAALEGFLSLSSALGRGLLDARTRARLAIAVADANACDYCLSAHTYLGKNFAKLDDADMAANREGGSTDPKADAAVRFALKIVRERGNIADNDLERVKAAGYTDAQVIEIVVHVALNTLTNYVNKVAQTDIDFPVVAHRPR